MRRDGTRGGWWRPLATVVSRELREMAWRKRTYATRAIAAAFLGLTVLLTLMMRGATDSPANTFLGAIGFYVMSLAAAVPVLASGVIAAEREHGTLPLLLLTPLRPGGILAGKVVAQAAVLLGLGLAAAPMLSLTFLFGGVDPETLLTTFAATFAFLLWVTALTVWCSARARTVGLALIATYVWGVVLGLLVPFTAVVVMATSRNSDMPWLLLCWHPYMLAMVLFGEGPGGMPRGLELLLVAGGNTAAILGFLLLAGRRLARETERAAEPPLGVRASARREVARAARLREKSEGRGRPGKVRPGCWGARLLDRAPALYLELRTARGRIPWRTRGFVIAIAALCGPLWWYLDDELDEDLLSSVILGGLVTVLYLAGLVHAARAIVAERESRRIELIWPTRIGPSRFLAVKVARLLCIDGLLLVAALTLAWFQGNQQHRFEDWFELIAGVCGSWIALLGIALAISAFCRRERAALEAMVGAGLFYSLGMGFSSRWLFESPLYVTVLGAGLLLFGAYAAWTRLHATWGAG